MSVFPQTQRITTGIPSRQRWETFPRSSLLWLDRSATPQALELVLERRKKSILPHLPGPGRIHLMASRLLSCQSFSLQSYPSPFEPIFHSNRLALCRTWLTERLTQGRQERRPDFHVHSASCGSGNSGSLSRYHKRHLEMLSFPCHRDSLQMS